jgi:hypothetical protein
MDKIIPFPQADDFQKVLKIINIANPDDLKQKKSMQIILGDITERQVQYYLNAVMFLGVIDLNKNFTELGIKIRKMNKFEQKIVLSQQIVSNKVFGEVYFSEKVLDIKFSKDEIVGVMKKYLKFQSEEIYYRRAQTILKWLEWVNNN